MNNPDEIQKLSDLKTKHTYYELGKLLNFHPNTIARWITTRKINPIYRELLKQRLSTI